MAISAPLTVEIIASFERSSLSWNTSSPSPESLSIALLLKSAGNSDFLNIQLSGITTKKACHIVGILNNALIDADYSANATVSNLNGVKYLIAY
jgi:hypothetical protein